MNPIPIMVLAATSVASLYWVLFAGRRQEDPNRQENKGDVEQRKEFFKRLNREENKGDVEQRKEFFKRLGLKPFHMTRFEDIIASDVVNPDHINVMFESIGGLDSIKQELYELVILPFRRPELFSSGKILGPQKGVLLYGPPGTGKTTLAKAIAKESGAFLINVRLSTLMSKRFGEAPKLVSAVFSLAYKLQPAIIFIDEVDSFLGKRNSTDHETSTIMKTEFMALWDGFTTDQNARVMVLATTNRPEALDEAVLRRFTNTFEIGKPGKSDLAKILKVTLKGERVDGNIDFDRVAGLCWGFTGSDISEVCKKAAYYPVREFLDYEKKGISSRPQRGLYQIDLEKAIVATRKSKNTAF